MSEQETVDPYIGGVYKWTNDSRGRHIKIISTAPATMFYGPGYYYRRATDDGEFTGVANRVRISAQTLEKIYTRTNTTKEASN